MNISYPVIKQISVLLAVIALSGAATAQQGDYSLNVKTAVSNVSQSNKVTGPVVRIMGRADNRISLSWVPFSEGVSHYILERSGDGRRFEEAGLFFTGEWGNEPVYHYTDKLKRAYAGPLFYRLRVVGLDGSEMYTTVTMADAQSNK